MSQPTSDLPLLHNTSCWSSDPEVETNIRGGHYRSSRGSEGRKCMPCPLRPAPLFRSIGLTGLSDSLPPHRRLRSLLHRARAVRPENTNLNETNKAQGGSFVSEEPDRVLPFKDSLPDITALGPSQTHQETRIKGSRLLGDVEAFSCFQSQSELRLNPNGDLADKFQRRHTMRHQDPPPKTREYTSRRTVVFPLSQNDTHSAETTETPAGTNRKRWNTKIRQIWTSEKGSDELDISERFHSLVMIDDRPSAYRNNRRASGSRKSDRNELESECEGNTRRDRRPHFLPPIAQTRCLLNVPFVPPENSPPPSPSSVFSPPFFPLSVPALPVLPRWRQRDT